MLKRIALILSLLLLTALVAACQPATSNASAQPSGGNKPLTTYPGADRVFVDKDTEIKMHAEAQPILSKLGEPQRKVEMDSCAFQGKDRQYSYASYDISTYTLNNKEYILSLTLNDDSVSTPENVSLGSNKADVITAYGDKGSQDGQALVFKSGGTGLRLILDDDVVTSIQYFAIVE